MEDDAAARPEVDPAGGPEADGAGTPLMPAMEEKR
jgi:hypothetical protein